MTRNYILGYYVHMYKWNKWLKIVLFKLTALPCLYMDVSEFCFSNLHKVRLTYPIGSDAMYRSLLDQSFVILLTCTTPSDGTNVGVVTRTLSLIISSSMWMWIWMILVIVAKRFIGRNTARQPFLVFRQVPWTNFIFQVTNMWCNQVRFNLNILLSKQLSVFYMS
jgi:hypothetical protein